MDHTEQGSPTFLAPGTGFMEGNFSIELERWGMVVEDSSALYLLCTYLYYYYVSSTSDHQA